MVVTVKQMTAWFVISFILVKTSTDALLSPRIRYQSTPSHYHNNFTYSPNRKRKRSRRMMQVSAANHLITEPLPLLDKPLNTSHWSGYIHLDGHDNNQEKNLFYWLFAPNVHDVDDKNNH